jgi:hypothetical protein
MAQVIEYMYDHTRMPEVDWDREIARRFYIPISLGEPLTPELLTLKPDPIFIRSPQRGDLSDIFSIYGVWIMNSKVKQLIDYIDPGIHIFIPVKLRDKEINKSWSDYYILHVGQVIDAIVIEETSFRDGDGRKGFNVAPILSSLRGHTVLDGRLIAQKHLWRGGASKSGEAAAPFAEYLFCSDELAENLKSAGAEGWLFRPCKTKVA